MDGLEDQSHAVLSAAVERSASVHIRKQRNQLKCKRNLEKLVAARKHM